MTSDICKLVSLDKAKELRERYCAQKKAVVTTNGSFDVLHAGHAYLLKKSREQGDVLFVGLNSDVSVRSYKHGQGPIVDETNRARLLDAIEYVDHIVLFDEPDPVRLIRILQPDVHCDGAEYGKDCVEAGIVKEVGAKLVLIPSEIRSGKDTLSTSLIIDKICKRYGKGEKTKALFLDRDGVINIDTGYTHKVSDLKLIDNCIKGLSKFSDSGYRLFIITNQSGIARGYFSEDDMHRFNDAILNLLLKEGIKIEKIYFCPHHPDHTGECGCRKPRPGLFQKAKKEYNIDMGQSIAIGDKDSDIVAAKNAGVGLAILMDGNYKSVDGTPDYRCTDIYDAYKQVTKRR